MSAKKTGIGSSSVIGSNWPIRVFEYCRGVIRPAMAAVTA
jgi:hypothetical protein